MAANRRASPIRASRFDPLNTSELRSCRILAAIQSSVDSTTDRNGLSALCLPSLFSMLSMVAVMWGSELVPLDIRKIALIQMLEHWADNGWGSDAGADGVLQFIKNHPRWVSLIPKLKEMELRTIARYKMKRVQSKTGERVIIPEIADYFLKKNPSGLFPDSLMATQLKDWLGDTEEALDILATYLADVPDDFNGIRLMATLHSSSGNFVEAVKSAQSLVKFAPWRTESYDCLAFTVEKAGDVTDGKNTVAVYINYRWRLEFSIWHRTGLANGIH